MAVFEMSLAVPSIAALQPGNPDIPPAGTVMVNVNDVPARLPVRFPLNTTMPSNVLAVTRPDTDLADCETVHDIVPAPVESETDPEYVPLRAGAVIADGAAGFGPGAGAELPHPESAAPSAIMTRP